MWVVIVFNDFTHTTHNRETEHTYTHRSRSVSLLASRFHRIPWTRFLMTVNPVTRPEGERTVVVKYGSRADGENVCIIGTRTYLSTPHVSEYFSRLSEIPGGMNCRSLELYWLKSNQYKTKPEREKGGEGRRRSRVSGSVSQWCRWSPSFCLLTQTHTHVHTYVYTFIHTSVHPYI